MSDEELRREQRLSDAGLPSRRRLVELSRLAEVLERTRAVALGDWPPSPSLCTRRLPIRACLEFWRGGRRAGFSISLAGAAVVEYFLEPEAIDALSTDVPTRIVVRENGYRVYRTFPLVPERACPCPARNPTTAEACSREAEHPGDHVSAWRPNSTRRIWSG